MLWVFRQHTRRDTPFPFSTTMYGATARIGREVPRLTRPRLAIFRPTRSARILRGAISTCGHKWGDTIRQRLHGFETPSPVPALMLETLRRPGSMSRNPTAEESIWE